jgi:hypothetical protein
MKRHATHVFKSAAILDPDNAEVARRLKALADPEPGR